MIENPQPIPVALFQYLFLVAQKDFLPMSSIFDVVTEKPNRQRLFFPFCEHVIIPMCQIKLHVQLPYLCFLCIHWEEVLGRSQDPLA